MKDYTKKILYILAGILILLILYTLKNTHYFVSVLGFLVSVLLFYLADTFLGLNFKNYHYFIFIFIAASGILFSSLYFIYSGYDKILHLISPILLGVLIFSLANRANVKFQTKLLITFSVVLMFLALFEIGEFALDKLFDLKLQGVFLRDVSGVAKLNIVMDRNDDTMIDLILGGVGSLVFTGYKLIIFNYQKIKENKKKKTKKK